MTFLSWFAYFQVASGDLIPFFLFLFLCRHDKMIKQMGQQLSKRSSDFSTNNPTPSLVRGLFFYSGDISHCMFCCLVFSNEEITCREQLLLLPFWPRISIYSFSLSRRWPFFPSSDSASFCSFTKVEVLFANNRHERPGQISGRMQISLGHARSLVPFSFRRSGLKKFSLSRSLSFAKRKVSHFVNART